MGLQIDWFGSTIQITSPTTSVDAQTLHDFIENEMVTPVGQGYGDIILPEGKIEDPGNPGPRSQIILIFNSPWQIQFWGGSGYTQVFGGKIVGGLNGQPIKATGTAGDITVLISPVDGLAVVVQTGSGVTEQDKLDIADRVWDESASQHVGAGSAGAMIQMKNVRKGVALPWFHFVLRDSSTKQPTTGVTGISGQACKDDGVWSALTNSVVEVGAGLYRVDGGLTATEMNADLISLRFTAADVDAAIVTVITTS